MRVELVGFSQGVSLSNKDEHQSYLDFRREDGRLFRLPVLEEALELLMSEIYDGDQQPLKISKPVEPAEEGGEEADDESNGSAGEESFGTSFGGDASQQGPVSEEEVPSL
jgi:hypothetical protein